MDYTPRHAQPFTFSQAAELDIPTITQEISRLEHSLQHLMRTQGELHEHISASPEGDPDLEEAKRENDTVIASQKERISMLKMVLEAKGINTSSGHYNLSGVAPSTDARQNGSTTQVSGLQDEQITRTEAAESEEDRDGGLYL